MIRRWSHGRRLGLHWGISELDIIWYSMQCTFGQLLTKIHLLRNEFTCMSMHRDISRTLLSRNVLYALISSPPSPFITRAHHCPVIHTSTTQIPHVPAHSSNLPYPPTHPASQPIPQHMCPVRPFQIEQQAASARCRVRRIPYIGRPPLAESSLQMCDSRTAIRWRCWARDALDWGARMCWCVWGHDTRGTGLTSHVLAPYVRKCRFVEGTVSVVALWILLQQMLHTGERCSTL